MPERTSLIWSPGHDGTPAVWRSDRVNIKPLGKIGEAKNVEHRVRWIYLVILGIASVRAQNGIIDDLAQITFFE